MNSISDVERLVAVDAITRLKYRYFRDVDRQNWDAVRNLFTADAICEIRPGTPLTVTEFIAESRAFLAEATSVHHGFMPEIDVTGPDSAIGTWSLRDHVRFRTDPPRADMHADGIYTERYRRVGGEWKIESMRLEWLLI